MLPFAIFSCCTQPYWLRTYVIIPQNLRNASIFSNFFKLFYHLSKLILADNFYTEIVRLLELAAGVLACQNKVCSL